MRPFAVVTVALAALLATLMPLPAFADGDCADFERVYPQLRDANNNGVFDMGDFVDTIIERTVVCADGGNASTWETIATRLATSSDLGISVVAPVPAPATMAPAPSAPIAPVAPASAPTSACRLINDYGLENRTEVATSGSQLHVEFWNEGQPERETLLAGPARYSLGRSLRGHVWEYAGCTSEEVMAQINAHIGRRIAQGANNAGFVQADPNIFRRTG